MPAEQRSLSHPCIALSIWIIAGLFWNTSADAAQRDRVFVASYGSDSNPCTFGSPCKTFQQAVDVVAPGGEVTAIDSAGFGPVAISKSVTITSPNGVEAGIAAPAGGDAIDITGSSLYVYLHGLTLEGANSAANGIKVSGASSGDVVIDIDDCFIQDYTNYGIDFDIGTVGELTITNSHFIKNAYSLYILSPANTYVTLDHDTFASDTNGIIAQASNAPIDLTVANSVFSGCNVAIEVSGDASNIVADVRLYNLVLQGNNYSIDMFANVNVSLSYVNDMHSSNSLYFDSPTNINVVSDGTSHVFLAGPNAPGSLGSYPFK